MVNIGLTKAFSLLEMLSVFAFTMAGKHLTKFDKM